MRTLKVIVIFDIHWTLSRIDEVRKWTFYTLNKASIIMPGEEQVSRGFLKQGRSSVSYIFQFKQYGKESTFDKFTAESKGIFCIQFHLELDASEFNRKIAVRKNDSEL